jgi:Flp pilus assembly protein TadG
LEKEMITRNNPESNKSEKGTAIVEAAIVLLTLFMFIFGIFEAGRFMNTQQVLTNAAREGARLAVTPLSGTDTLPNNSEITARVESFLTSAGIACSGCVTVTQELVTTGAVQTSYTRVQVENDYQVLTVPLFFDMLEVTLKGEALMRNETSD